MKIDFNYIDQLLNKYWEGETSVDEEKVIKEYYRSAEIHENHEAYKDLFVFFDNEANVSFTGDLNKKKKTVSLFRNRLTQIAASIVLIIAVGTLVFKNIDYGIGNGNEMWVKYEVEDPELAKEKAFEALEYLSIKFNKGEENIRENFQSLNKMPIH